MIHAICDPIRRLFAGGAMPAALRRSARPLRALSVVALVGGATALAASSSEAPFLAENDAAMTKMMAAMTIKPSGDVDRDFVAMMAPHHLGAVDMAQAELRYGRNEKLRRIAQEIVVEQLQQIPAMHLALGEPVTAPASSVPSPGGRPAVCGHSITMTKEP